MSSFNRRGVLVLLAGAGAGCTFTPALAPNGPASKLMGRVTVRAPTDKNSFDLVERLEERLDRPRNPAYELSYTIRTEAIGVGITTENAITRHNLTGSIDWVLSDITGARMTGGKVQSFTSYSATGSTVAGLAAEEDAAYRLMRLLADQIVARLIAASASLP